MDGIGDHSKYAAMAIPQSSTSVPDPTIIHRHIPIKPPKARVISSIGSWFHDFSSGKRKVVNVFAKHQPNKSI